MVHCAAGKDRTGLICALTHHIAGVSHEDIIADYLLTNDESRLARKMDFLGPWIEKQVGDHGVAARRCASRCRSTPTTWRRPSR